jgi:hypothetical protein
LLFSTTTTVHQILPICEQQLTRSRKHKQYDIMEALGDERHTSFGGRHVKCGLAGCRGVQRIQPVLQPRNRRQINYEARTIGIGKRREWNDNMNWAEGVQERLRRGR